MAIILPLAWLVACGSTIRRMEHELTKSQTYSLGLFVGLVAATIHIMILSR